MRIHTIRLTAYGPFTDMSITLPPDDGDFHLIYGPNEAGKSSSLRAVRHMLFGIPARTTDNFLHAYARMRIGGRLVHSDGSVIDFVRRKGQVRTLRAGDDETVLDDDSLASYLGGIGQDLFEQMFAIGHADLIRGGEEIISGKGRIGEALFAAGAGLIRLQGIQQGLDQVGAALFKPSGSTPAINQTLAAIRSARKAQKEAQLLANTWQDHDRRLREARDRLEAVQAALDRHRQRASRCRRIRDALPLIARRKEISVELIELRDVSDLPDAFGDKRRDAERELMVARRDRDHFRENHRTLTRRISELPVPATLLACAAAVEALQHELGSFRKAQKDRPGLEGRMRTVTSQAAGILDELGATTAAASAPLLRLPPHVVGEIQELGQAYERLSAMLESAAVQQRKRHSRLEHLIAQQSQMSLPVDITSLEVAMQAAQAAGPMASQLADITQSVETLADDLNRRLQRQVLWRGPLETVDTIAFASRETVDRFEKALDAVQLRIEQASAEKQKLQSEIEHLRSELQAIDLAHPVPTESDLAAARSLRDRGWRLIRLALNGNRSTPSDRQAFIRQIDGSDGDLPDAFETSMTRADTIADRLRREAAQVSRKGLLEARREQSMAALSRVVAELDDAQAARRELLAQWRQLWAPMAIEPLTPAEMRGWGAEMTRLGEQLAGLRADRTRRDALAAALAGLKSDLRRALEHAGVAPAPETALGGLIEMARIHVDTQRECHARRTAAEREIRSLREDIADGENEAADLNQALDRWQQAWAKNVRRVGLAADASPTAALAVIESLREVKGKLAEADVLQKRIDGIDRDAADFQTRVDELVDAVAPELSSEPRDRAAEMLYARLTAARKDASVRHGLFEQRETADRAAMDATMRINQAEALLAALCQEAGCPDATQLPEAEQRARRRRELLQAAESLDDQLRRLSAGATVGAFTAEAEAVNADGIAADIQAADEAIARLEQDRSALDQTIGSETAERRRMDGGGTAADHAEAAERLLATLETDVQQYARIKIAAVILARTVERYRDRHQGPLIRRASDLFARMTLGRFSRLRAEYDDKGNPILVGVRSQSGAQVTVDGMSDGTADQLYLALRLASLEQYLENNEPLPFIVDDILLRFDDDRALATLGVLADLSVKTQILFFTHHQHLMQLVQRSPELAGVLSMQTLADGNGR